MIIAGTKITAAPDSGSMENVIGEGTANELRLELGNDEQHQKEFRKPDGRITKAIGRVIAVCSFAKDQVENMSCYFYVLKKQSAPVMGETFLTATETLSKSRHRMHPKEEILISPYEYLLSTIRGADCVALWNQSRYLPTQILDLRQILFP